LRSALLHDWQVGFPLRDAPFDAIGQALGATPREVLHHLRMLKQEGAFSRIGPTWGPGVAAAQWLCGVDWPAGRSAEIGPALAALPCVASASVAQGPWPLHTPWPRGWPTLWFTLAGLHTSALAAQVKHIEREWQLPVLALQGAALPAGPVIAGPAEDAPLAAWCEAGLPLLRHPFEAAARVLKRMQRDVLGTLRAWQASGALQHLGVQCADGTGGYAAHAALHTAVLLAAPPPDAELVARLARAPGIARVQLLAPHPTLPYTLHVLALGAPALAAHNLSLALQRCGLAPCASVGWHARSVHLAVSPRLFAPACMEPDHVGT
jgi:hypothetical protein